MKIEFCNRDSAQQFYSVSHLENLVQQSVHNPGSVSQFVSKFTGISAKALQMGHIDEGFRCQLLLCGLPHWMHSRVLRELKYAYVSRHDYKWISVLRKVKEYLENDMTDRKMQEERGVVAHPPEPTRQIAQPATVQEPRMMDRFPPPRFNPAGMPPLGQGRPDPAVTDLTHRMQAMSLPVGANISSATMPEMDVQNYPRQPSYDPPAPAPFDKVGYGSMQPGYAPARFGPCFYCGLQGHSFSETLQHLQH